MIPCGDTKVGDRIRVCCNRAHRSPAFHFGPRTVIGFCPGGRAMFKGGRCGRFVYYADSWIKVRP
jgi:hypothetical protein